MSNNGICTSCGHTYDMDAETHECNNEKRSVMRVALKLIYKLMVYADPNSTAQQKSDALDFIQTRRAWIEANVSKIQDLIS